MNTRSYRLVTAVSAAFVLLMGIGDEAVARGGGGGGAVAVEVIPVAALPQAVAFRPARGDPAR